MNDEIYHHGVKGMKWGIRHDDKPTGKKRSKSDDDSSDKKFHLSDKQKKILKVGVAVTATALAAYGAYKLSEFYMKPANNTVPEVPKYVKPSREKLRADLETREIDAGLGFFKKRTLGTPEQDLAAINENGFFNRTKGATSNCTFCTTAYELRRRGYDVRANLTDVGRTPKHASRFFKDAKLVTDSDMAGISRDSFIDRVTKKLLENGEGSRGNFCGTYSMFLGGGGHSIIWEVQNGTVLFRDGQTGQNYKSAKDALGHFVPGQSTFWRTDNLAIDVDRIKEAVSTQGTTRKFARVMESEPEVANSVREIILKVKRLNNMSLKEARDYVYTLNGLSR